MRRVDDLVALGQPRHGLSKLLLLERVQAEAWFVKQQDGVSELVLSLGVEHDKEGHKPTEALASLVQFNRHAQIVLNQGLEVLTVDVEPQGEGFVVPNFSNLPRESDSGCLQSPLP